MNMWQTNKICRKIDVYINKTRYIEITAITEIEDLKNLNSSPANHHNILTIDRLYYLIDKSTIKITSIFLQPTGDGNMLDSRKIVDKLVEHIGSQPVYFTIIRDIFDRLYSEYSYLNNDMSSHEPFRNSVSNYQNFEDFLIKSESYSNIITKHIAYNMSLNEDSFRLVTDFFKEFTIGTMQNIQEVATAVWTQCYGWCADCTNQSFFKNENTKKENITILDISDQAQKQFLLKTEWDRKLYAYLSQT